MLLLNQVKGKPQIKVPEKDIRSTPLERRSAYSKNITKPLVKLELDTAYDSAVALSRTPTAKKGSRMTVDVESAVVSRCATPTNKYTPRKVVKAEGQCWILKANVEGIVGIMFISLKVQSR